MLNEAGTQIRLPQREGKVWFDLDEIVRFEATGNYSFVILTDGRRMLISTTIMIYTRMLPAERFWRVHKTHLVNRAYIDDISRANSQQAGFAQLSQGDIIPVSRRRFIHFNDRLSAWKQNRLPNLSPA